MLTVNTQAPAFELKDQNEEIHTLAQYKGKKVILYFYPKDNTPGCTKQACGFSDLSTQFKDHNVVILGVSKDSVKSHKKFEEKYQLRFPILSDESLDCLKAYDVWKEKMNYGKTYMGIARTTYLIDEEGKIIFASDKIKAAENPLQMLEMFQ